jgi:hypothetical protein
LSKTVKVLLILAAGFVVFLVVAVGAGAMWWKANKVRLMEGGSKAMAEGKAFGTSRQDASCVDEAFRRLDSGSGFTDEIHNRLFLSACLKEAQPTPGFCEGVPAMGEIMSSVKWSLTTCTRRGKANDQPCSRLVQEIQKHCHAEATSSRR